MLVSHRGHGIHGLIDSKAWLSLGGRHYCKLLRMRYLGRCFLKSQTTKPTYCEIKRCKNNCLNRFMNTYQYMNLDQSSL